MIEKEGLDPMQRWIMRYEQKKSVSLLYHIKTGQLPILIMHGLDDIIVQPEEAKRYYDALCAAVNHARLLLLPDLNHSFIVYHYERTFNGVSHSLEEIHQFLKGIGLFD